MIKSKKQDSPGPIKEALDLIGDDTVSLYFAIKSLREILTDNKNATTQLEILEMMLFSNIRISSEILFRVARIEDHLGISRLPNITATNGKLRELTKPKPLKQKERTKP